MSEMAAWVFGLVTGAGLVGAAWVLAEHRAVRLELLRAANESALQRRAAGWYVTGGRPAPIEFRGRRDREGNGR